MDRSIDRYRRQQAERGARNLYRAGEDWVVCSEIGRRAFLEAAGPRMAALLGLYQGCSEPGLAPPVGSLDLEALFATGMLRAIQRFRIVSEPGGGGACLLAEAPLAPFASLQRDAPSPFANGSIPHAVIAAEMPVLTLAGRPKLLGMRGVLADVETLILAAILPLRAQHGEIVECLVAFREERGDVSGGLGEELLARDLHQEQ